MSSTRKAESGSPMRQERFCSSPEFERGLMANLVGKRCEVLSAPSDRELVYFLQLLSHQEGGLFKVAQDLLAMFPERIGTLSMHRYGKRAGQVYTSDQVKEVREELPNGEDTFLLRGEKTSIEWLINPGDEPTQGDSEPQYPASYSADQFLQICEAESHKLEHYLAELCLNPEIRFDAPKPWYFPALISSLREYLAGWIKKRSHHTVITELGRQVFETLDYSLEARCLVLIDGLARTGKTFATKAWCERRPGRVRYVQVPSSSDDIGFFRAIAKSLGVSVNLNSKAQQLRERVEDVLQRGHLMVVFDEAHYLWPTSNYREALPGRINWIMTALVNHEIPVALVTTPQFIRTQKRIETRTCWTSEQFIGRIGHYQKLPDSLSGADLGAVAKSLMPESDSKSHELLVVYAQSSAKYLAGIEAVVRRARFLAGKDDRKKIGLADVKRAIQESVIPSDSALTQALADPRANKRRAHAKPVQGSCNTTFERSNSTSQPSQSETILAARSAAGNLSGTNDRVRLDEVPLEA